MVTGREISPERTRELFWLPSGFIDTVVTPRDFTLSRNARMQPKMKLEIDCLSNINMSHVRVIRKYGRKPESNAAVPCRHLNERVCYYSAATLRKSFFFKYLLCFFAFKIYQKSRECLERHSLLIYYFRFSSAIFAIFSANYVVREDHADDVLVTSVR